MDQPGESGATPSGGTFTAAAWLSTFVVVDLLDGSGRIDTGDYDVWRTNFGQTCGSGAGASANTAIPEPATLLMLLVGMLTLYCRRQVAVS